MASDGGDYEIKTLVKRHCVANDHYPQARRVNLNIGFIIYHNLALKPQLKPIMAYFQSG